MGPRQQPAKGAACPRPPAQAAGAGPSGQPVGHGRSPLTVDMRLRTGMGCRRVRLRTGGAPARGRGTFKCGRNERRRRRLRRAGGLHGGTVSRWRRRHRRPARIARRPGHQRAAASPARGSRRTPAGSPAGSGVTGARLASHAGRVTSGRRRVRRAGRVALARGVQGAALVATAPRSRGGSRKSGCGSRRYGAALAGWLPQITHARGVGAIVGIASSTYGHQCHKGPRLVVSQAIWGCFGVVSRGTPTPMGRQGPARSTRWRRRRWGVAAHAHNSAAAGRVQG